MIGGNSVLPTVCAMAWMADAAEALYSDYRFHGLVNYKLFKGVVFDGSEATDYHIDLKLINDTKDASKPLHLDAKISSITSNKNINGNGSGKTVFHYGAELILQPVTAKKSLPNASLSDSVLKAKPAAESALSQAKQLYNNGTLFHGDSLQGIKEIIRCDAQGLLLACQVPPSALAKQGEFPLEKYNIFANDLVYQAMLVWVRKQMGMGSLPSSTKAWTIYEQVQTTQAFFLELTVIEQSANKLIADISLISADNKLLAQVTGAEVTANESLNRLFDHSERLDTATISEL